MEKNTKILLSLFLFIVLVIFIGLNNLDFSNLTGDATAGWKCIDDNNKGYQYSDGSWYPKYSSVARKWACGTNQICKNGICIAPTQIPSTVTTPNQPTVSILDQTATTARITISWNSVPEVGSQDPKSGYYLLKKTNGADERQLQGMSLGYRNTYFTDIVQRGNSYSYKVVAYNTIAQSYPSTETTINVLSNVPSQPQGTETSTISVRAGPNLISVPLKMEDMRPEIVFPDIVSIWEFNGSAFFRPSTLEVGKGYWATFSSARDYTIAGVRDDALYKINTEIWPALPWGWTMIGPGYGANIPISSLPTNLGIFWWDGSRYVQITSGNLQNGKGYWINKGNGEGIRAAAIPTIEVCSNDINYVCGADDKGYTNECEAQKAGTTVAYYGTCSNPTSCLTNYNPVCGIYVNSEGIKGERTYNNKCESIMAGTTTIYLGECSCSADSNLVCSSGQIFKNGCVAQKAGFGAGSPVGWQCYNNEIRGYKNNNCQWNNTMTYCPNSCSNGNCL